MKNPAPTLDRAVLAEQLGVDSAGAPRRRRRLVLAGAAVALGLALLALLLRGESGPVRFRTEPARRGTLTVTVSATGTLSPTNQVDVGSELSGVVRSVEADYDAHVEKGDVLVRLDTTKLEAQAAQNRAALASAEAKVALARATVEEDRLQLERLERVRAVSGGKVPAQADLDAAVAALARARADLAAASASAMQARATLDATQVDLGKAVIRSPVSGVVLVRSIEPGQTVAATLQAPVLFTVAEDLRRMELQVDVDEADVGRVKAGQEARFTVDAFPDRTFSAKVEQVRIGGTSTSGVVTYTTVLTVDNADEALFPSMTATAEIIVERHEDALLVPTEALRFTPAPDAAPRPAGSAIQRLLPGPPRRPAAQADQSGSGGPAGSQVWVQRDGRLVRVPVRTGASDGDVTQLAEGDLEAGTEVVVGTIEAAP